ncbi:MAG TPA: heme lyase CcmF/NrfE family subunit [Gammaproteobacteria bacterium]
MIPELGHFALILALCLAIVQGTLPLAGTALRNTSWMQIAVPAARWQFGCLALAFACLTYAFIDKDFSVLYVAQNSNSLLPVYYRISAVWGAHEGSLLLWVLILGGWTFAITHFSRSLPLAFTSRVLAVLGLVSVGFLLFMLLTSNPFERHFPAVERGDLNPLLQDFGLIVHPPMLYMGYVGLAVPFAFAIAALLEGRIDAAWTRWTRPWTIVAWVFLTLGIALGSWWAYYELGWGGWWFWDPVENASFMPWLLGTALLHSLAVTEQRSTFKAWTILLAIFGFSLSLLGTFLVRSGVLVSVHAFATDPTRGVFILGFLSIVIGGALLLYAWRAGGVSSTGRFELVSREMLLLLNNVLLVVVCAAILLGTLYPLLMDALGAGKISVGPPYFNRVFIPLMVPLALILGFGPLVHWKKDSLPSLVRRMHKTALIGIVLGVAFVLLAVGPASLGVTLAVILACWVMAGTLQTLKSRLSPQDLGGSLRRLSRGFVGMLLAHFGVGIFIIGVTLVSAFEKTEDVRMAPGDHYMLGDYRFEFRELNTVNGPNYEAKQATFEIVRNERRIATLYPEKRFYRSSNQPMTEAGINPGLFRDLYVSLGEPLDTDGSDAWAVHLTYKPFVRWIWLGPLLMGLGGLLAASDRRYFRRQPVPGTRPVTVRAKPAEGRS